MRVIKHEIDEQKERVFIYHSSNTSPEYIIPLDYYRLAHSHGWEGLATGGTLDTFGGGTNAPQRRNQ